MTDARSIRAAQIKQTRRSILDALKQTYPADLSLLSLRYVLAEIEEHYLRQDVQYLLDKGLLTRTDAKRGALWDDRRFKLTARGVETADQITVDPALDP